MGKHGRPLPPLSELLRAPTCGGLKKLKKLSTGSSLVWGLASLGAPFLGFFFISLTVTWAGNCARALGGLGFAGCGVQCHPTATLLGPHALARLPAFQSQAGQRPAKGRPKAPKALPLPTFSPSLKPLPRLQPTGQSPIKARSNVQFKSRSKPSQSPVTPPLTFFPGFQSILVPSERSSTASRPSSM